MIFVAGASGGLGRAIYDQLGSDCIGTHFSKKYKNTLNVDFLNSSEELKNLINKSKLVISTIALTDVDLSEKDYNLSYNTTFLINKKIAEICHDLNKKMIFISTNDVFDGNKGLYHEYDVPNPINNYSIHKLEAENFIKNNLNNYLIIRTSILDFYSSFKQQTLINKIFNCINNQQEITLFNDSFNSPLHTSTIKNFILNKNNYDLNGLVHLYSDKVSKYDIGIITSKIMKKEIRINSISINSYEFTAKRPKDVSLTSKVANNNFFIEDEIRKAIGI